MSKNVIIGQSGGPTAAINATLAGVIDKLLKSNKVLKVLGSVNGVMGIINENFVSLDKFRDEEMLNLLKQTPSSYLGSCRFKLPDVSIDDTYYKKIFDNLKKNNVGSFIYIGGNDSMDTVDKLSKYATENEIDISIIGVPKTIDNDLILTDHTPGFGSSAKFIVNSIRQLAMDTSVYDMKSIIVAEVMGRNAGWLTAASVLANSENFNPVDIICLPEVAFNRDKFLNTVSSVMEKKDMTIIVVSEGVKDEKGIYLTKSDTLKSNSDGFSHTSLGGISKYMESTIANELNIKTRGIEFSTLQRCSSMTASLCDINESFAQGEYGATLALEDKTGLMVGITREDTTEYLPHITSFNVCDVANKEKSIPKNMIDSNNLFVTNDFITYAKPLIQGEPNVKYKDGLIQFVIR